MKKILILTAVFIMTLSLSACKEEPKQEDSFSVKIICESDDIYQIFYFCYFDDEYYGMGGMADYDKKALTEETELTLTFTKSYFEGKEDVSDFSIDFSPYGKDDTSEIATTERLYIHAEYGECYTVIFGRDKTNGFYAQLQD